ncbi:SH3 domain-containing protein [Streptomyces sp. NBC_00879]|uniref:SH3 domain-containing protein n=1 Tax=Streptomyces sp. NBC_00879 TaxID=2975855 RepID=UPI00386ECA71|nr:SH3 domain-containing protein [Streptomyces sp. NBC_00879]
MGTVVSMLVGAAGTAGALGSSSCTGQTHNGTYKAKQDLVNLRSGPGTSYDAKGLIPRGTTVHLECSVLKSDGVWYYVTPKTGVHKGAKGWIRTDAIAW